MENSVGTFRTDRLMQGNRPSQVTVNTGSTVVAETVAATRLLKDSFITGHHVYKTIWTPFLMETLSVETEEDNQYNFNAR